MRHRSTHHTSALALEYMTNRSHSHITQQHPTIIQDILSEQVNHDRVTGPKHMPRCSAAFGCNKLQKHTQHDHDHEYYTDDTAMSQIRVIRICQEQHDNMVHLSHLIMHHAFSNDRKSTLFMHPAQEQPIIGHSTSKSRCAQLAPRWRHTFYKHNQLRPNIEKHLSQPGVVYISDLEPKREYDSCIKRSLQSILGPVLAQGEENKERDTTPV